MELVLYLKPLIDMMWKLKFLDIILVLIILFITPMYLLKNKYKLNYVDFLILFICILFTISFINNPTSNAFIIYIKVITNLYMIFIGRLLIDIQSKSEILAKTYSLVVIINLIYMLIGEGFTHWGNARTFIGFYFFKTDLALAILQALVFIRLMIKSENKIIKLQAKILIFIVCPMLIILSNSRVYTLTYLLIIYILYIENKEYIKGKRYEVNIRFAIKMGIIILIGLNIYSYVVEYIPWFKENGFVTFKFDTLQDLLSPANTQGRSVTWAITMENFKSSSILNQLIGIDLVSDGAILNGVFYDSHNNYIKILYSTGYIGLISFAILIIYAIKKANKSEIQVKYTFIMLLSMYLISSISVPNIVNTNQSFLFFLYLGFISKYKC